MKEGFTTSTTEGAQKFLENLIGYYIIMEGIFFYSGFVMILSFHRQNKMTGIWRAVPIYLARRDDPSQLRNRSDQWN